jgi:hypothetical protein
MHEETAMDDMHEIKELLREIRDLQKAHFERYRDFTQALLDRQEAGAEEARRTRDEQRRYREEMRHAVNESRQRVKTLQASRWFIVAIVIALAILTLGGVMMPVVLRVIRM